MLTAKDASGSMFTLPITADFEMLHTIRKRKFFCPCCDGDLILKAGSIKIPHFAHKSSIECTAASEPESQYHLLGKRKLFSWLLSRGISAELESYLPGIRQRADILAVIGEVTYAVEFQCSSISQAEFEKRTNSYRRAGISPVWLLSEKSMDSNSRTNFNMNAFQSLFLCGSTAAPFLLTYCPLENLLIIRRNIVAFSPRKWLGESAAFLLDRLPPKMNLKLQTPNWFYEWWRNRESWCASMVNHGSIKNPFLLKLYANGLSVASLPAEIGIPVCGSHMIETAAIQWQFLIYLGALINVPVNGIVTAGVVKKCVSRHIKRGDIRLRSLPLLDEVNAWIPAMDYLKLLDTAGYLEKISGSAWRKRKDFTILETKQEQQEFFRRWHLILKDHWQCGDRNFSDYFPLFR
ncbi:hypothetical protein D0469_13060 [Peribacillus saganii]|uniref:Competence protein CoiA n=1 Tax=Peribacillus saganii TaxID=2303992 RepID=A0A372LNU8_9BACI|nr:competence protein CoiA family protein [Peribacillus saganii]RFU68016.1 hypothetical protein D0469_13060 [Peribacillus saganii]